MRGTLGAVVTKELEQVVQYREQAAAMLRLSERATDARQKAQWLEMAALYHQLAEQFAEIHRLDTKPDE